MGMVGCLGDIIFTVSEKAVLTLDNWKWSGAARYAVHQRHMGNALTELTGLDPDKITFDITLSAELGIDPMEQLTRLWNYERTGAAVPLTVGTHGYGRYRWNIVSHDAAIQYTDPRGDLMGAVVSVTLQEYLRVNQQMPTVWTYKR